MEIIENILIIIENLLSKLLIPFLTGYIFFKIVELLTLKISIKQYTCNYISNEDCNEIKVVWFSAKEKKNNKKDYTYRFKINDKYLIFINRYDLQLIDRLKLSCWLIKEYFLCNKNNNKVLPLFLIEKYIEPEYIKLKYNYDQIYKDVVNIIKK